MSSPVARPSDYESFPYMRRGIDFPAVELSDPRHRRSGFAAALDEEQVARVERLLADNVVISFHDHPQLFPADLSDVSAFLRTTREFTAFTELRRSGLTAIFDNWFGVIGSTTPSGWQWDDLITTLGMRLADLAHQDGVAAVRVRGQCRGDHLVLVADRAVEGGSVDAREGRQQPGVRQHPDGEGLRLAGGHGEQRARPHAAPRDAPARDAPVDEAEDPEQHHHAADERQPVHQPAHVAAEPRDLLDEAGGDEGVADRPGRKTVSTSVRCEFICAIGSSYS